MSRSLMAIHSLKTDTEPWHARMSANQLRAHLLLYQLLPLSHMEMRGRLTPSQSRLGGEHHPTRIICLA